MYAVIETGGKQYRVELGSEIAVEHLDAEAGSTLEIDRVLLIADGDEAAVGRPVVEGARVSASVLRQDRGDKVVVFKYKPKARRRVKHGHRQEQTILRVADIVYGDKSAARRAEEEKAERERLAAEAATAAAERAAADKALAEKLAPKAEADATEAEKPARPAARRPRAAAGEAKKADTTASRPRAASKTPAREQAPEPESKPRRAPKKDA